MSLRTITRDLNWLRDAGLPVTAHRGRLGGVTMLPGSGLDLSRLTPGEREHLSLTGLDDTQRAELDASVESRRALSKIGAARQPTRTMPSRPGCGSLRAICQGRPPSPQRSSISGKTSMR
ncbi:hypothetical protein ACF090_08320 [Streptomyces sp. NPDC014892]|uniref:hypothetical protein n=1 Tax=Streptomyces sp. NPDC014892 TaxID=3364930 RepID=UPI0036F8A9A7